MEKNLKDSPSGLNSTCGKLKTLSLAAPPARVCACVSVRVVCVCVHVHVVCVCMCVAVME